MAQADRSNTGADDAGMMEDIGNDRTVSNESAVTTETAPGSIEYKRGKRGNSDTRGSPSTTTN